MMVSLRRSGGSASWATERGSGGSRTVFTWSPNAGAADNDVAWMKRRSTRLGPFRGSETTEVTGLREVRETSVFATRRRLLPREARTLLAGVILMNMVDLASD